MKHTWSFVRKSDICDHPEWYELPDSELKNWIKCRGIFQSRQTGELTHKKIKTDNMSYHAKRHFGLTHEQACS